MKKLLLLLLVFPFVFIACSDDDDDNGKNPEQTIVGTWISATTTATAKSDKDEASKEIEASIIDEIGIAKDYLKMELKADKTFVRSELDDETGYVPTRRGTYEIEGNKIIMTFAINEKEDGTDINEFKLEGNTLHIIYSLTEDVIDSPADYYDVEKYPDLKVDSAIGNVSFSRSK